MATREIRFFNTLGKSLEPFEAGTPGEVRLYACGPTVYNHAHIGNLRAFLFEDLLRRSLKFLGYRVTQVMNLTDVDDKTIREAGKLGVPLDDYTAPYIESFFSDLDTLRVERAERYPRATEHVSEMINIIETLIEKGHAYTREGSVWFRIKSDDDYGRLSGVDLDSVQRGERVASDEYEKDDVRDFVLWKAAKPGEPSWPSPWGDGRPGWHIECSAMSMKYLGESFDIHCGGVDNIFPHHENEIAQSESATGKTLAHTWLHSEHLIVDGRKMSKSLGNQYTLGELLERGADPRALRYVYLSVHYRQKLNFTFESLNAASGALRRVDEMRFRLKSAKIAGPARPEVGQAVEHLLEDFAAALADDLNSAAALGVLFTFVREVNRAVEGGLGDGDLERVLAALERTDEVLGVLDPEAWSHDGEASAEGLSDDEVEEKLAARQAARANRDFAAADRLRDELQEAGIVIEDTSQGPRWKRG